MVKESNSLRNKKLHSSKPYDVSNSFVKKVTSRVTNLLPQPTWLSKWFTSSVDNEGQRRDALNSNDSGSEDDDDTINVQAPPAKRAKIPLNQQFPPSSFKVSPIINDQVSTQQAGPSRIIRDGFVTDGAVAGPSGINTRQQLVSSTPNIQPTPTHLLAGTERKMNGDDRSESSESTSGCSSLVPQANRQFQGGENAMNSLSGRRRSMDEKLNFTGHLQSPRSLFSDRSHSRSPRLLNSSLNRRKPSFNVSSFGSPVLRKDKSSAKSIINSPFYAGKTIYGGASAYRRTKDGFFVPSEVASQKRCGVQVKVNSASDSLSGMSTTARRILEALEEFSTPVLDAKRIPVESTPSLSGSRKRPHDLGLSPILRQGQSPRTPNSARSQTCGLTIPTVPDLLKMRHREKLQDSLEAARLIAASSANSPVLSSYPRNVDREYRLRFEDEGQTGRHGGKIRGKEKELLVETVEAVNLPNISLQLTSLPKFDFVVPPAASTPTVTSTFKFASPITVTQNARTCLPADNFTFSKPLSALDNKDPTISRKINCVDTSIPNCPIKLGEMQFISGSDNKLLSSERGDGKIVSRKNSSQSSDVCFGIKPATELKTGSVMDILGKKPSLIGKEELKEVSSSSSSISLDKFKPAPGTWECGTCMIRNKSDATRCAACETSRMSVGSVSSTTAPMPACPGMQLGISKDSWECSSCHVQNLYSATVCRKCLAARTGQKSSQAKDPEQPREKPAASVSGFGNKFKPSSDTWECGTCLVRNPDSSKKCQACETKRPVLATKSMPTSSSKSSLGLGFGDKFKKPSGSWDCPDCMVQNGSDSLKCVACERAKPGSESQSTIKFNYTIPAEASGFNFGIDKAGVSVKETGTASSLNTQGFKFGETKVTTVSEFSFGVTQANESKRPVVATKSTPTSSSVSTVDGSFGDRFKKPPGSWDCPDCMVQNNRDSLKCVACGRAKPDLETQSTMKLNFGIDKAGASVKESDVATKSNVQGFTFGETKVTTAPGFSFGITNSVPNTTKSDTGMFSTSTVVTSSFGNGAVTKPANTSSLSKQGYSFGVPQPSKFQSPASSEDNLPSENVPKKRRSFDTSEVIVNSKGSKLSEIERNSGMTRTPALSTESPTDTKKIEAKPEDKVTKRVTFTFGSTSGPASFTSEKPNISTKTVECAKPSFGFNTPPVCTTASLNFSSVKPATTTPNFNFTSSNATFGNNPSGTITTTAAVTTGTTSSSVGSAACTTTTATTTAISTAPLGASVTSTTASNLFSFGATKSTVTFGGSSSGLAFGQCPNTSAPTPTFGASLKNAAPPTFSFGSNVTQTKPFGISNEESVETTASKKQAPSFGSITNTATVTAFGPLTTAANIASPSFGSATTSPSFSLGARGTIPAFGAPNSTSTCTTTTSAPGFSTGFSSLNEQKPTVNKSTSNPGLFTFGSGNNSGTSSLGQAAPFSFGSIQNDQGIANKGTFGFGTPSSSNALGPGTSTPASNSGFGFVSSNHTPQVGSTFNFGSNTVTTSSPAIPSVFGAAPSNATAPASGTVFGAPAVASSASLFGASNTNIVATTAAVTAATSTTSAGLSAPAFGFGSSNSQPSSNMFGFTASQTAGSTNVPVQNFTSPTSTFNFNQPQSSAQPSALSAAPTFDPYVRPSFNFTRGETPSFTAAGATATPGPQRRIKKAVRRTHPR